MSSVNVSTADHIADHIEWKLQYQLAWRRVTQVDHNVNVKVDISTDTLRLIANGLVMIATIAGGYIPSRRGIP